MSMPISCLFKNGLHGIPVERDVLSLAVEAEVCVEVDRDGPQAFCFQV